jgi:predicted nucleic acid-binding protein
LKYLLDTATCIGLINGKYPVRARLTRAQESGGDFFVSAVSIFELSRELGKGTGDSHLLETFLSGPVTVLALEAEDARAASYIEGALNGTGPPDSSEALIAGQALARGMVLVGIGATALSQVKGLASQDWGKP